MKDLIALTAIAAFTVASAVTDKPPAFATDKAIAAGEGLVQHRSEIVTGRIIRSSSRSHLFSKAGYCRQPGLKGASRVRCRGPQNPDGRWLREAQQRAGSMPSRSVR